MQDYQTHQTDYCRAVQIQAPQDRPEIVPDPDGFGYRVQCHSPGYGFYWKPIRKGDFILYYAEADAGRRESKTHVRGVLPADDFKGLWTPRKPAEAGPTTRTVLESLRNIIGQKPDYDGRCAFVLSPADVKAFLAEFGLVA